MCPISWGEKSAVRGINLYLSTGTVPDKSLQLFCNKKNKAVMLKKYWCK